jgi:hypothetical protein
MSLPADRVARWVVGRWPAASFLASIGPVANSGSHVTLYWRGSSAVELSPRRDDKTVVPGPTIVFVAAEATMNCLLGGAR